MEAKREWSERDLDYVRKNYGYRTKMALCRHFGVTEKCFSRMLRDHRIRWKDPKDRKVKTPDLNAVQLVYRKVGKLLVGARPDRIDQVAEKYERHLYGG